MHTVFFQILFVQTWHVNCITHLKTFVYYRVLCFGAVCEGYLCVSRFFLPSSIWAQQIDWI